MRRFDVLISLVVGCTVFTPLAAYASATSTAYERGLADYLLENFPQALKEFDSAVKSDLRDALAIRERGATYANLGKTDLAIKDLDRSLVLDPQSWRAYNWRGYCYLCEGQRAKGVADLSRAIELWRPEIGDVQKDLMYLNRAKALEKMGNHTQSLADRRVGQRVGMINGARMLRESGDTKRALAVANEAVKQMPTDPTAYWIKACIEQNGGNYQESEQDLSKAIKLAPTFTPLYYLRADCYTELGKPDLAISDYSTILKIKPRLAAFRFIFETGRFKGKNNKQDHGAVNMADIHILRAHVYFTRHDYARAAADYSDAISLDAREREAYLERGKCYVLLGRFVEAERDFGKAIALAPDMVDTYLERARMYEATKALGKAEADYNKIVDSDRTEGGGYYLRGQFFERNGRLKQALADYSTDIGLDEQDEQALISRGDLYVKMQNYALACKDYQKALLLVPKGEALARKLKGKIADLDKSKS